MNNLVLYKSIFQLFKPNVTSGLQKGSEQVENGFFREIIREIGKIVVPLHPISS